MNQNIIQVNENGNVIVKASQILKKLKTYKDRKNFALENSKFHFLILDWYMPKETGYDASFMLEVLRGHKKYLPLSVSSDYNLSYFRSGDTLTKRYIIEKINGNNAYSYYLPNGVTFEKLSRKFLLMVI